MKRLIFWFLIIFVAMYFYAFSLHSLAGNLPKFDHSSCQYPDRTTNPSNGCDNSDPCDPLDAVKGGSGDCSIPQPRRFDYSQVSGK